jgi:hypothetical protein
VTTSQAQLFHHIERQRVQKCTFDFARAEDIEILTIWRALSNQRLNHEEIINGVSATTWAELVASEVEIRGYDLSDPWFKE